jgi:hypothetical protein
MRSPVLRERLVDALDRIAAERAVRVLVLTGAGKGSARRRRAAWWTEAWRGL